MSDKILEALQKLDVNNDAHWTMEGLPKLDTIKFFAGGVGTTREELAAIAPGFSRESLRAYLARAEDGKKPAIPPPPPVTNGTGGGEPSPVSYDAGSSSREVEIETLAAEIDRKSQAVIELKRIHDEAGKAVVSAQKELDKLTDRMVELNPPPTNQDTIRLHLEGQKRIYEERAKNIRMIKESGVDLKVLAKMTAKSPLDTAFANRRGNARRM